MSRGDVYRFNLDPTVGSEIKKARMCVVVMHDPGGNSPVTIICPLTGAGGRPGNLLNPAVPAGIAGTTKDSRVACHQVRTLDKRRALGSKVGELPAAVMEHVSAGLKAVLGL
ncbi:MAG TPA: type II toxin-antitoxin system PemK/MazF family toxin [Candidatus Elarobacter sp.]|jgi:mRNA interferase MazF